MPFFPDVNSISSRDALSVLFFGSISLIFLLAIAFFLIKLVYNITVGLIIDFFPRGWDSLIHSIFLLIILSLAFSVIEKTEMAGLTASYQINKIVEKTKGHNIKVEINKAPKSFQFSLFINVLILYFNPSVVIVTAP